MIDTNKLTQHAALLKGALDEHAVQAAGHLRTISGFAAGFLDNDTDQQAAALRAAAAELGLFASKLADVSGRITETVGAPAADNEPIASGGMPKAEAYKSAAKDRAVATDSSVSHVPLPRYMGERQAPKSTARPSQAQQLLGTPSVAKDSASGMTLPRYAGERQQAPKPPRGPSLADKLLGTDHSVAKDATPGLSLPRYMGERQGR